jgi:hypothetical protein
MLPSMNTVPAGMNQPPHFIQESPYKISCREFGGIQLSEAIAGLAEAVTSHLDFISGAAKLRGSEIELNGSVVGIISLPWVLT